MLTEQTRKQTITLQLWSVRNRKKMVHEEATDRDGNTNFSCVSDKDAKLVEDRKGQQYARVGERKEKDGEESEIAVATFAGLDSVTSGCNYAT